MDMMIHERLNVGSYPLLGMPTDNNLLTATGQSMYSIVMSTALQRLLDKDYVGCWDAFKAVYCILDPECTKDCTPIYQETVESLRAISEEKTNMFFVDYEIKLKIEDYLSVKLWEILRVFSTSLYNKGYTVFVSNRPPTRESSLKDLEFNLAKSKYGKT